MWTSFPRVSRPSRRAARLTSASRPSADAARRLADALGVSTDYLMEGTTEEAAKARFEDRELLRQFQEVESLPDDDKLVVKKLLDAFLTKKQIQRLAE